MILRFWTILFLPSILLLAILLIPKQLGAEPASTLSPIMPSQGTPSRKATYRVDFRVAVHAPANTEKLRVWLPLPPKTDSQQITDRRLETFPRAVEPSIQTEPVFGNTFAYFEFQQPDGAREIRHQFTAQVNQVVWDVDYSKVSRPEVWPPSFDVFRRPDPRSEQADELNEVLHQITASSVSDSDSLLNAMAWVDRNLTYDHHKASLTADPMHALIHRRGHCSDYHGLCGTLAREVGFPSRLLYGLQMFDKGSPSHCKLEVFLPPYGWVSYDLSETQKLGIQIAADPSLSSQQREERLGSIKQRTLRGFRENTWLLVTRGVNYELAPRATHPVTVVRTIYAEADGVPLVETDPSDTAQSMFAWLTMHRVDEVGDASRRFQVIE